MACRNYIFTVFLIRNSIKLAGETANGDETRNVCEGGSRTYKFQTFVRAADEIIKSDLRFVVSWKDSEASDLDALSIIPESLAVSLSAIR